jgi:hypothetical protein
MIYNLLILGEVAMEKANTSDIVQKTCSLLVLHFRNLCEYGQAGFNSRIFEHMLHPEKDFVFAGKSRAVTADTPTHPEHVVPCATMVYECQRLIQEGRLSNEEIASLLQRHWKLATITKDEQRRLDFELGFKSSMPDGWKFEDGDTFARFSLANIVLVNK